MILHRLCLKMESQFYAVVVEKVLAMHVGEEDSHQVELHRGMTVEIEDSREKYTTIRIKDYYQQTFAYENNVYLCKTSALFSVPVDFWPFLIAINDPMERVNIAKDKNFIHYLLRLQTEGYVTVRGEYFNLLPPNQTLSFLPEREPKDRSLDYDCIVKYIGPVEEIGSPGCLFGLQLLVNFKGQKKSQSYHSKDSS